MTQPLVKAFVFDVFGTVVDWRGGIAREAASFLNALGQANASPEAFADAWRSRYAPAMQKVRSGERPFVRLDVLHRENLDDVLPEFGINKDAVPTHVLDELNLAWHRLDPWPDSVKGLARLKTRYIIAPLSNGNIKLMVDMAKHGGLPWDAILGAETAQAYKPTPQAYLRAVDALMLKPEEVCMAAAHNSDLVAARACGLKAAFIARPYEHGARQATDLRAESDWDFIVNDLNELADAAGA
ncbi:haloacid dehalogenase type II [Caballeronia sp. LP006]|uniref:haloacid dehalogenase type II n=1 Tax=Caballeronia sp. LP006 TaxID=3038552 RepID=UPI002857D39C|nr:haloacid dehalogenase type II [Caballeronia sp. LP006]MDR5827145.1 haloacid dehalogenase type II [Caballeronia sp. LP006]